MIWVRRTLASFLIGISVILLIVLLPISQINDTAGNPEFYKDQIRRADLYNFIYDEVIPAGLDELEADDASDITIDVSKIENDIISVAKKLLPPDWLQAETEAAIDAVIPYFTNDIDRFTLTVELRERVDSAADVIKEDVLGEEIFTSVYDDGMSYLAEELYENQDEAPYSLSLSKEEIENSLRNVVPEGWLIEEVEAAVDSFMPYLRGSSNNFIITVHLGTQVDAAADAAIDLFTGQETYDYLLDELITPIVQTNLGEAVDLPFGITLTEEEITSTIKEVIPLPWVRERLSDIIYGAAAYLKGEVDSIEVTIDLGDRKAVALDVLTELADQKLQALFYSLPECSMAQFLQIAQGLPPNTLPSCRPSGVSYEEAINMLGIDIAGSIDQMIGDQIPDTWIYTDADLRRSLGEGNEQLLDDAREWVTEGWTYTDADLIDELDEDERDTLEDVRGWIKSGYVFAETDLRDAISDNDEDLRSLDDARRWTGTARTWIVITWLVYFLIIALIGLLGGRSWTGRLAWSLMVLFCTSFVFLIVIAIIYPIVVEPRIQDIQLDPLEYEAVEVVLVEKGNEIISNVFDGYFAGMRNILLFMVIGSGVPLVGLVVWRRMSLRRSTRAD